MNGVTRPMPSVPGIARAAAFATATTSSFIVTFAAGVPTPLFVYEQTWGFPTWQALEDLGSAAIFRRTSASSNEGLPHGQPRSLLCLS
jgi:hypothetical protein